MRELHTLVPLRPLALALGLLAVAVSSPPVAAEEPRPNIVLAMTDDQGWHDVGYAGHPVLETPNLDRMAENAVRFTRFYAQHPVCSPTRASVMTGRHPNRYRCFSWGCDLPLREVTVAEAVKQVGYRTGHFGKWHLGGIPHGPGGNNRSNLAYPEGSPERPRHPGHQGFDQWVSHGNWFDINPKHLYHNGERMGRVQGETSEIVMGRALEFIRASAKKDRPFLAVIWFPSPHGPHKAAKKYRKPYADTDHPDYYGELAAVDHAMGRLRKTLRDLGVAKNTLVWFCSDNGGHKPEANNGGLRDDKGSLWEGGIRVPGLLEWPARIDEATTTDVPASTSDIYPTLVDVLGLEPSEQVDPIDGITLVPLLRGEMEERPEPIGFEKRSLGGKPRVAALVDDKYKLRLTSLHGDEPSASLYNLVDDPKEQRDIASEKPAVADRMRKQLQKWRASVERDMKQYPTQ